MNIFWIVVRGSTPFRVTPLSGIIAREMALDICVGNPKSSLGGQALVVRVDLAGSRTPQRPMLSEADRPCPTATTVWGASTDALGLSM